MKRLRRLFGAALALAACSSTSPLGDGGERPQTGAAGKDGGAGATGTAGMGGGGSGTGGGAGGEAVDAAAETGTAGGNADGGPDGAAPTDQTVVWDQSGVRDLDVLFMVDNSFSMKTWQTKLVAAFPAFMDVLAHQPGGLPSLHLAVVNADMGAGRFDASDVPNCRHGGDQGKFQFAPLGLSCGAAALNAGQTFISSVGGQVNFTGTIADAFGCIAALGETGCGYEHQLASVARALGADGAPAPATNANFLRANARLAIVLFTNEDDCSAPADATLFDPGSRYLSDPLGPLISYRCNEFGHLCGGARPPRTPAGLADLSGTCHSAEDGPLLSVSKLAAQIKSLKADPAQLVVSAIAADPSTYVVERITPFLSDEPAGLWPAIKHSCNETGGASGDPAVRIADWLAAFGAQGSFTSICALTDALQSVAKKITVGAPTAPCIDYLMRDTDPTTPGVQPRCTIVEHVTTAAGVRIDTAVPYCDPGVPEPCWSVFLAPTCSGELIRVARPAEPTPPIRTTTVTCEVCPPGDKRPGCPPTR